MLREVDTVEHALGPERKGWVQVARGEVILNGAPMGPGVAVEAGPELAIFGRGEGGLLLVDMA